jgi:hypothetical protein
MESGIVPTLCCPPKIMSNLFFSNTHSHKMYSSIHSFIQHPSIHSSNIPLSIHPTSLYPFIQHPSIHSFTHLFNIYSSIHPYILWTNLSILSLLLFLKRNRPSFTISKHIITNQSIFHAKFVLICVLRCFSLFPHSSLLLCFVVWIFVFLRIKNLTKKKEEIGEKIENKRIKNFIWTKR